MVDQRIQATGELAWINRTKTTGGLRFTSLSAEARQQVSNWTSQSAPALSFDDASSHPVPTLRAFPGDIGVQPESKAAPLEVASPGRKRLASWSGFSAGLGVGVLVSALVWAALSFHSYRRRFGASIIQFGERVAAKPQVQPQMASPELCSRSCRRRLPYRLQPRQFRLHDSPNRSYRSPLKMRQLNSEVQHHIKRSPSPWPPTPAWLVAVGSSRPKAPTANSSTLISETPPPASLPTIIVTSRSYLIQSNLEPAFRRSHRRARPMSTRWFLGERTPALHRKCISRWANSRISPPASEVKDKLATSWFSSVGHSEAPFSGNSSRACGSLRQRPEAKAAGRSA